MKLLIDGDTLTYRAAFSQDGQTIGGICDKIDELVGNILEATNPYATKDDYQIYLTGKGNFRHQFTKTYKANRADKEKPILLGVARQHFMENYDASVSVDQEADDDIAIEATRLYPDCVVVSIDKDFLQVPGTNYNPAKNVWTKVDEWTGLNFFYQQTLTGDAVDNVIGVYKVGPVKAEKILTGCQTELDLYNACLEAYKGDEESLITNARLLWLRRYEGQIWEPPNV